MPDGVTRVRRVPDVRLRALALGLVALLAGCRRPPDLRPALDALPVEWAPFRWVDLELGGARLPRASVLVRWQPTDDTELQLDFGLGAQGRFGLPIRKLAVIDSTPSSLHGSLAALGDRDDSSAARFKVGTLGLLAFYIGRSTVLIDPTTRRIGRIGAVDSLPASIRARLRFGAGREIDGRFLLPIAVGGESRGEVLVDPANSLVPLWIEEPLWREATGRSGGEQGNQRLVLPTASGPDLVFEGAPVRRRVLVGGLSLRPGVVYRRVSGPPASSLSELPGPIVGVAGNAVLEASPLLVIDLRRKRFAAYH